jgi:acetate kinase
MLGKGPEGTKIIVCHLGNGSSITAVKDGKSVDTSMGLTPLDGLMMGTRCGSIDPAIIPYIIKNCGVKVEDLNNFMNKKCGVQGISGVSSDFRDLEEAAEKGNKRAQLALDMFVYQVRKFIGSYIAALNGVDAIVFTAGIGENDCEVRRHVMEGLNNLGAEIDVEKNKVRGQQVDITGPNSKIKVFVIPTNEELMIAKETMALVK